MTVRAHWRTDEERIVREHYPRGGSEAVQALLPHRSTGAIRYHAWSLGIACPDRWHRWTLAEMRKLREVYTTEGGHAAARALRLPVHAVWRKANELGLRSPYARRRRAA